MGNKPFYQEDDQPFDYFKEAKPAEMQPVKPEASSTENLVTSLRADMLPASEAVPESKSILQRINLKLVIGIFIIIVVLGLIWYMVSGPGRSALEKKLEGIVEVRNTPTQAIAHTPTTVIELTPSPSNTPVPNPTLRPTNTQEIVIFPSPTPLPPSATPIVTATSSSGCRNALSITLEDVGQSMCVEGIVIETITNPSNFMVIFSTERGAFYWVTYDLVWSQGELDTCYQTQGTIDQIANSPVLVFGYSNLPEVCP